LRTWGIGAVAGRAVALGTWGVRTVAGRAVALGTWSIGTVASRAVAYGAVALRTWGIGAVAGRAVALGTWGVRTIAGRTGWAVALRAITSRSCLCRVGGGTFDWFLFVTGSATLGFFVTARKKMEQE
jgi:hypothetical protein